MVPFALGSVGLFIATSLFLNCAMARIRLSCCCLLLAMRRWSNQYSPDNTAPLCLVAVVTILFEQTVDCIMPDQVRTVFAPRGSGYIDREDLQRLLEGLFDSEAGHDFKIRVRNPNDGLGHTLKQAAYQRSVDVPGAQRSNRSECESLDTERKAVC